ncbi:MAG: hypothetical protein ABSE73_12755, partial [Planctomycetota bacterium]
DDADTVRLAGADNPSLGPKPTILVASPVPAGEIAYKRQRLGDLEKLIGIRPVWLSYHPQMALMEGVFVRDYPEEYLAGEYKGLATSLMAQIGDDSQRLASEVRVLWKEENDLTGAITRALRLASDVPDLGITMLGLLGRTGQEPDGNHVPELRQVYAALSQNAETRLAALNGWGFALLERAKTKTGDEAGHLLQQARQKLLESERMHAGSGAYNLACVEAMEGNTNEAVRWLQVFKSAGGRLSRAKIAAEKDFELERRMLLTAFPHTPKSSEYHLLYSLAFCHRSLKDYRGAVRYMELAATMLQEGSPERANCLYSLAILQKNDGCLGAALQSIRTALKINPESWNLKMIEAGFMVLNGEREEGRKRFEMIARPRGDAQFYEDMLAWFYAVDKQREKFYTQFEHALSLSRSPHTLVWIEQDVDLDVYRGEPEFKALVEKHRRRILGEPQSDREPQPTGNEAEPAKQ